MTEKRANWPMIYATAVILLGGALAAIFWAVPLRGEERDYFAPMIKGGWMAWTFPVALFFWVIATLLVTFTLLAIRFPETPRRGILGLETTRGDRLFISLLGSAFICLAWLFFAGPPVWGGLAIALIWAVVIFAFA